MIIRKSGARRDMKPYAKGSIVSYGVSFFGEKKFYFEVSGVVVELTSVETKDLKDKLTTLLENYPSE